MLRFVMIPVVAVIAGVIWIYTLGTLFGVLLLLGGVMALGLPFLPMAMERIGQMLSAGRFEDKS